MAVSLIKNGWQQNPIPDLGTVPEWWVSDVNGNDSWDGQSEVHVVGTNIGPFKTIERLCDVLFPAGAITELLTIAIIHVAGGDYGKLRVNVDNQPDAAFFFWVICEFDEGDDITLNHVVNTNPTGNPATSARGEIETAAGTFVNKKRIRIKSGSNPDAVAWSTGLNGGDPKKTFVTNWTDGTVTTVDAAVNDVVGVNDYLVTFDEVDLQIHGFGGIIIQDASLPNGGVCKSTNFLDAIQIYRCKIGGNWSGTASIFACDIGQLTVFQDGFFRFAGNAYHADVVIQYHCFPLIEGAHCSDGAGWTFQTGCPNVYVVPGSGEPANTAWEFVNGTGKTAITLSPGCTVRLDMRCWSVTGAGTGAYALGFKVGSSTGVAYSILPSIVATNESNIGGVNKAFSTWPFQDAAHMCGTVLIT